MHSWTRAFGYQLSIDLRISLDVLPLPCPGCPPALSSTLHMAARSRGLLVIFFVPGCSSLWTPPRLGVSHLAEWKRLPLTATVMTGFPQARRRLCRHGHPAGMAESTPPFFTLPKLPTGNWASMLETQRRPGVLGNQGGPMYGERGDWAAHGPGFLSS